MSQILCVNRSDLTVTQGFSGDLGLAVKQIVTSSYHYPRKAAEDDANIKQIIPYTLVCRDEKFLAYQRSPRGDSLTGKWSVGFGGHVEERSWIDARSRELFEEAGLSHTDGPFVTVGVVNDDSDHVGRCHFGIVSVFMLRSDANIKFGTEVADSKWVTKAEALRLPNLEKWSRMTLEGLDHDGEV